MLFSFNHLGYLEAQEVELSDVSYTRRLSSSAAVATAARPRISLIRLVPILAPLEVPWPMELSTPVLIIRSDRSHPRLMVPR
mgnify:CR=1 FL=1